MSVYSVYQQAIFFYLYLSITLFKSSAQSHHKFCSFTLWWKACSLHFTYFITFVVWWFTTHLVFNIFSLSHSSFYCTHISRWKDLFPSLIMLVVACLGIIYVLFWLTILNSLNVMLFDMQCHVYIFHNWFIEPCLLNKHASILQTQIATQSCCACLRCVAGCCHGNQSITQCDFQSTNLEWPYCHSRFVHCAWNTFCAPYPLQQIANKSYILYTSDISQKFCAFFLLTFTDLYITLLLYYMLIV